MSRPVTRKSVQQGQIKFVGCDVQNPAPPPQLYAPEQPTEPNNAMEEDQEMADATDQKPAWMKKIQGVKKISNKERRRRQNQHLRKLLTPKSALMVLNEIVPGEQLVFKVEPVQDGTCYKTTDICFSAEVTIEGKTFKAVGESKASARHAAAELAIRELIISRLSRLPHKDHTNGKPADGETKPDGSGDENMETSEEEPMPMIQLASFALHKLFSEWEGTGHRVPQLRPASNAQQQRQMQSPEPEPVPKQPKVRTAVPENASSMHPCMLLAYMRPRTHYRVLACSGDRPQNYEFKMAIDVDGATFVGTGKNKKEARKQAAISACNALFEVNFEE